MYFVVCLADFVIERNDLNDGCVYVLCAILLIPCVAAVVGAAIDTFRRKR